MPEWIAKYWIEWLFGIVAAVLAGFVRHLYNRVNKKVNEFKTKDAAQNEAILSLLDDRLGNIYNKCKAAGQRNIEQSRRYTRMYEAYHALGGNGAVTDEYEQFKKIPLVQE